MRLILVSVLLCLTFVASDAHAAISAERRAAYQSLLQQPYNLQLNQQYANLCITEQDYEAAIPALERLVALQPSNALLRLRLGEMFRLLGSEAVARNYFHEALVHPYASAEIKSKAQGYLQ